MPKREVLVVPGFHQDVVWRRPPPEQAAIRQAQFDSAWDAVHTFIRVPAGAFLAAAALTLRIVDGGPLLAWQSIMAEAVKTLPVEDWGVPAGMTAIDFCADDRYNGYGGTGLPIAEDRHCLRHPHVSDREPCDPVRRSGATVQRQGVHGGLVLGIEAQTVVADTSADPQRQRRFRQVG